MINEWPEALLRPMLHHLEVCLESLKPPIKRGHQPSEMLIVTFFPQAPGGYHKHLHEHGPSPLSFGYMQKAQPVSRSPPVDPQPVPARFAEGAPKEQMFHRFLRGVSHRRHVYMSSLSFIFLLFNILRVLILSAMTSQAKTFHLLVHFDRQIQEKASSASISRKQYL